MERNTRNNHVSRRMSGDIKMIGDRRQVGGVFVLVFYVHGNDLPDQSDRQRRCDSCLAGRLIPTRSFFGNLLSYENLVPSRHFGVMESLPHYIISGSKDDPSNCRGICISSCLGKLFGSILNILNNRLLNFSHKRKIS